MSAIRQQCSICNTDFEMRFRYQMEERSQAAADGTTETGFLFFCSQKCLEESHSKSTDGLSQCSACAKRFRIEFASQIMYSAGQRNYACSDACRDQLTRELNGERLGAVADTVGPAPVAIPDPQPHLAAVANGPRPRSLLPKEPIAARDASKLPPSRIAVFNHKGGTGKTTTAVSVAGGLAERGYRVLLVDTDAQGNVGVSLNLEAQRSLYHVLVMGLPVAQAVTQVRPGLDVLPSNETLAAAELYLAGRKQRDRVLAARLSSALDDYDFTIIDCSPSLSLMNQNALVVADGVLCPVACDYLSLVGVRQVLRTLKHVNSLLHHPVEFWGVLPTMYDVRAHICHEALDTLKEHFGERCLSPIRAATKVKEAPAHGRTLLEHAPDSKATAGYQELIERLAANRPAKNKLAMTAGGTG